MAYDWQQGLQGGAAGAGAGSAGGPWGAGIGGLLGMLAGFGGGGTEDQMKQFEQFSPEQQDFFKNIFSQLQGGQIGQGYQQGMSGLQDLLDPSSEAMSRFADPYMKQFQQQTVPGLAEQFAGAGATGGALSSSGFGQALGGAGSQLQTQLAGMKSQLQRQAIGDIFGQYNKLSSMGMGAQPFGYTYQQGGPGVGQQALSSYAGSGFPGLSQGFGSLLSQRSKSGGGSGSASFGPRG